MTEPKLPASPVSPETWSGRFSEPVSDLVKRYTASVMFDRRMWRLGSGLPIEEVDVPVVSSQ